MLPYIVATGCLWYRVSEVKLCREREISLDVVKEHFVAPMGCCLFTLSWHGLGLLFGWGEAGFLNSIEMIAGSVASLFIANLRVPIAMFDTVMAFNEYKLKSDTDKLICGMGDNASIGQELLNNEVSHKRLLVTKIGGKYYYIKAKCYKDAVDLIQDTCSSVPRESVSHMCSCLGLGSLEFSFGFLCQSIQDIVKCRFTDGVYLVHSSNVSRICICPVCGTATFAEKISGECREAYCSDTCRETAKTYGIVECGVTGFDIISDEEFAGYVNTNPLESGADTSSATTSAKDIAQDFAGHVIKKRGAKAIADVAADELGELGGSVVKTALRTRESIRDVAKYMDGKMSSTQLMKNLVTQGGGIAGAMVGGPLGQILIPIPIVGACVGSWVGGKLGKKIAGGVAQGFGEDDAVVVGRYLMEVFQFLAVRYCLEYAEMDILFNAVEAANSKEYVEEVLSSGEGARPHIAKTLLPVVNRIVRKKHLPYAT